MLAQRPYGELQRQHTNIRQTDKQNNTRNTRRTDNNKKSQLKPALIIVELLEENCSE